MWPSEVDCVELEPVVVGRACVGDYYHIPVMVEGVPSFALVDTGSTVTLVRTDILPSWAELEPTTVQLCPVTGNLAPMKGRGMLTLNVGDKTIHHPVWVTALQDPCILGLDVLRSTGCLNLERGTLSFQGGLSVTMGPSNVPARPVIPHTQAPMQSVNIPSHQIDCS